MISKQALKTVISDQWKEFESLKDSVPRSVFSKASSYTGASAFVVKGVRRCGKSTLLKQLLKAKFDGNFFYFNFDDDRIAGFITADFQTLIETLIEAYGEKKTVLFDEIQNIAGWELFINRILRQGYKVFITGSNANLISKELGTHLTGRHVDIELYPFSFCEFLKANKIEVPRKGFYSTEQKAQLSKKFKEYILKGGMPEPVVLKNEEMLTQVFNDIVQKDIVTRYNPRKPSELKIVLKFLLANVSNPITYRSIQSNFNIKSANTIQKYTEYAEETYLVFSVQRFEKTLKKFDKNPKKIYCVDNGLILKNTPTILERKGALLENIDAVQLKRIGKEFYYYKNKSSHNEADFVVPDEKTAIQVCYELTDTNKERELKGLTDAMKETKANTGHILTLEQEQEIEYNDKKIPVKPVWQWLIETEPDNT